MFVAAVCIIALIFGVGTLVELLFWEVPPLFHWSWIHAVETQAIEVSADVFYNEAHVIDVKPLTRLACGLVWSEFFREDIVVYSQFLQYVIYRHLVPDVVKRPDSCRIKRSQICQYRTSLARACFSAEELLDGGVDAGLQFTLELVPGGIKLLYCLSASFQSRLQLTHTYEAVIKMKTITRLDCIRAFVRIVIMS